jgi:hypothetical protein
MGMGNLAQGEEVLPHGGDVFSLCGRLCPHRQVEKLRSA